MASAVSFDKYASDYTETVEDSIGFLGRRLQFFTQMKVDELCALAQRLPRPLAESRVLDVGCGAGLTDALLLPHVGELHGLDVSAGMVEQAARRNPAAAYGVYDGDRLPFEAHSFDLAFAVCVVHHVPPSSWDAFIAELWRVTRPGGLAVVIEHNPLNPLTRRSVRNCEFDADAVLLGPRRVTRSLRQAGAAEVHRHYIAFSPFRRGLFRRVERALGWCPGGAQHVVWAQRSMVPVAEVSGRCHGREIAADSRSDRCHPTRTSAG